MTIAKGNLDYRRGDYSSALIEYSMVDSKSPLRKYADFNISNLISKSLKSFSLCEQPFSAPAHETTLSVIIPTYNVESLVEASIFTVLLQIWKDCEIIIVDDNSSDSTYDRCLNLQRALPHIIRCYRLPINTVGGCGPASNYGIKKACGKYIAFCDSDDLLAPGSLQKLVRYAVEYSCDCVLGDFKLLYPDGEVQTSYDQQRLRKVANRLVKRSESDELFAQFARLSPVPWRKLYKADLLQPGPNFPEVDHFFEDNPFHWSYLTRCDSIYACTDIIAYHRMNREGQTMSSASMLAISHYNNPYYIHSIISSAPGSGLATEYSKWIKHGLAYIHERMIKEPLFKVIAKTRHDYAIADCSIESRESVRHIYSLTIIVPSYNCLSFLESLVPDLLRLQGCQVIIVDNFSTDGSYEWLEANYAKTESFLYLQCKAPGAGRARNMAISFALGEYCFFLDADDKFVSGNLMDSVKLANQQKNDVFIFSYKIRYEPEGNTRDAFNADKAILQRLSTHLTQEEIKMECLSLINYPWNRIVRTDLLRRYAIVFGHTLVNNDIPFHWHSLLASENIGFDSSSCACIHYKFSDRQQITTTSGPRRLQLIDSLEFTYEKIRTLLNSPQKARYIRFCFDMRDWCYNQNLVNESDKTSFDNKFNELINTIDDVSHDSDRRQT